MDQRGGCIVCQIPESQRIKNEKNPVQETLQQIQENVIICDFQRFFSMSKPSSENDEKIWINLADH